MTIEKFRVPVRVLDVKMAYGRALYQVTPVAWGKINKALGVEWVEARRVTLEERKP